MVLDFSELNEKTIADAYPLPNIAVILDRLGGANYFSVFDLASGFYQINMHRDDCLKTAFTPYGHYEYVRMPMGLRNAKIGGYGFKVEKYLFICSFTSTG